MEQKKKKGIRFLSFLLLITAGMLIIFSTTLTIFACKRTNKVLETNVQNNLVTAARDISSYCTGILASGQEIPYEHTSIDSLSDLNIGLTIFLDGKSFISSVYTTSGRAEGVSASAKAWDEVMKGNSCIETDCVIEGKTFFASYVPLFNVDGTIVGMCGAFMDKAIIDQEKSESRIIMIKIEVVLLIVYCIFYSIIGILISRKLKSIEKTLRSYAAGDLTSGIDTVTAITEFNGIADSANELRTNIGQAIGNIQSVSESVKDCSNHISSSVEVSSAASEGIVYAIEEMSKASMEMANAVQNTASAMQDIGNEIEEIAALSASAKKSAAQVNAISADAKTNLNDLMQANASTMNVSEEVVTGIREASNAINEISTAADVISSIAAQTNLLSLNASIEAARAGEAGRGFAVVAQEISNLASQSEQSTKEIKQIIDNIVEKSNSNVNLAAKIRESVNSEGQALSQVQTSFDKVNEQIVISEKAIDDILDKASAVEKSKMVVLDDVSSLSSISEENAASCQETNASMEELNANIEIIHGQTEDISVATQELVKAVEFFNI